jgi:hypothetical protein
VERDILLPGINIMFQQELYFSISQLKYDTIKKNGSESVRIFSYLYDTEKNKECLGIYLQDISHKEFIWKLAFTYSTFVSYNSETREILDVPNYGILDLDRYSIVFFPDLPFRGDL